MGTHSHSQTHALDTQASLCFNPFSLFGSNWHDPESTKHFQGFSIYQQQATSVSTSGACTKSLTLGACIEECPDGKASPVMSFHSPPHFVYTLIQNSPGALGVPRGDPPNDPLDDDPDSDFNSPDTSDIKDADPVVVFTNLTKAIKSLAKSSHHHLSETLQCTKV